jgi:hypothetical protein
MHDSSVCDQHTLLSNFGQLSTHPSTAQVSFRLHSCPNYAYWKTGADIGLLQGLQFSPVSTITLIIYIHPGVWVSEWVSKRPPGWYSWWKLRLLVAIKLQLWLSHTLLFNGNRVRIWVTISSRLAAVVMKQSGGTYTSVGIAASEITDNTHQYEICALLRYHAAYSGINPYRSFGTNCR